MARVDLPAAAILATALLGCTPSVDGNLVTLVGDDGQPATAFEVPLEPVGTSYVVELPVKNFGDSFAKPLAFALAGPAGGDFTLDGGGDCATAMLDSGATCSLKLDYHANVVGKSHAELAITADTTSTVALDTDAFQPSP